MVRGEAVATDHEVAAALVVVVSWMLRRTTIGLHLRAAGERPDSLDAAGVSVARVRTGAELFVGVMAGVGGAYLSIVAAGTFQPFVTNGAGFIANYLEYSSANAGGISMPVTNLFTWETSRGTTGRRCR